MADPHEGRLKMNIEELKKRKAETGFSNKALAEMSGVPLGTVQKIFSGATRSPRRDTIQALARILYSQPDLDELMSGLPNHTPPGGVLCEPPAAYGAAASASAKQPGEYTLEDYLALPDDQRVELIDGVFYDMAAPNTLHQAIAGFIYKLLLDHVLEHKGPCKPFMSPVDVQLDRDDRTVVQPDVLIICDVEKFQNGRVFGAPDFLVEVLSPSTRKRDMSLKLYKYANAGVREYWIVDPVKKAVLVYDLEQMDIPVIYGFGDRIPVKIWNGECVVDFKAIYEYISFLL